MIEIEIAQTVSYQKVSDLLPFRQGQYILPGY
jgi:hypothetical protein